MTADEIIEDLGTRMYSGALSGVRDKREYPDIENPLHVVALLIDCDTEVLMQGMLGFLENSTGAHLGATIRAPRLIGADKVADHLARVELCMRRHDVTWERLRGGSEGAKAFQITSSRELHGEGLDAFSRDVADVAAGFEPFNHESGGRVYDLLCAYVEPRMATLCEEMVRRGAKPMGLIDAGPSRRGGAASAAYVCAGEWPLETVSGCQNLACGFPAALGKWRLLIPGAPEGRRRIAQEFIPGLAGHDNREVPQGRQSRLCPRIESSVVPTGLGMGGAAVPRNEFLGYSLTSLRDWEGVQRRAHGERRYLVSVRDCEGG